MGLTRFFGQGECRARNRPLGLSRPWHALIAGGTEPMACADAPLGVGEIHPSCSPDGAKRSRNRPDPYFA